MREATTMPGGGQGPGLEVGRVCSRATLGAWIRRVRPPDMGAVRERLQLLPAVICHCALGDLGHGGGDGLWLVTHMEVYWCRSCERLSLMLRLGGGDRGPCLGDCPLVRSRRRGLPLFVPLLHPITARLRSWCRRSALGWSVCPVLCGYPCTEGSFMRPNPRLDVEFVPLSERELVPVL